MHTALRALVLPIVLGFVGSAATQQRAPDAPVAAATADAAPRTVILLRHAEKSAPAKPQDGAPPAADDRDPGLSDPGRERAALLARLLSKAGVTNLYTSEYKRTRETLVPLAKQLAREAEVVRAGDLDALAAKLDALAPGSVAVVCGHGNTIPDVCARLGAPLAPDAKGSTTIDERAHDRLFVITRPAEGKPALLELAYGDASGPSASAGR